MENLNTKGGFYKGTLSGLPEGTLSSLMLTELMADFSIKVDAILTEVKSEFKREMKPETEVELQNMIMGALVTGMKTTWEKFFAHGIIGADFFTKPVNQGNSQ
jgi:hypothetical protein